MKKIILAAIVVATTLVACNKESSEIAEPENTAVEFTNGIITRASGTEWASGDKIGIYMFSTGTTTVIESKGNIEYYNSQATDGESATFNVVESDQIIYYPQNDVTVDFLAYYPYSSTKVGVSDFVYEVDVNSANQADQTLIDLMVSDNLTEKIISKSALSFEFVHALSQINFVVTSGIGTPSLDGLKITVSGLINSADYDLTTDGIDFGSTEATDLEIAAGLSAIIIPQSADLTFKFATTDNPTGFEVTEDDMSFEAGESATLTFVLNRTSVDFSGESIITNWEPTDNGSVQVY